MAGEWWERGLRSFGLSGVTPSRVAASFILFRWGELSAGLWRLFSSSLPGILYWAERLAGLIAPPLPAKERGGERYLLLEDGSAVVLTAWGGADLPRQKTERELEELAGFLGRLRRRTEGARETPPLSPGRSWLVCWRERIRRLESFALVAARRLHPGEFDRAFLRRYETIRQEAEESLAALEAALARAGRRTVVGPERVERFYFYQEEKGKIGLKSPACLSASEPMRDVYRLFVRYLPRLGFSSRAAVAAAGLYRAACPEIDKEEWGVLLAALRFPEDYYRLACRYFLHLEPWPLQTFLRQECRIWATDLARRALVEELGAFLSNCLPREEGGMRLAAIGLLGGTFDPIHLGHLVLAETARESFGLEKVIFMPAGQPPHKHRAMAAAHDRLRMVEMAVADNPYFAVSTLEIERPGPSYTVDTVVALRRSAPAAEWYLIIGSDALAELPTWHEYEQLLGLVRVLAAARPGAELALPPVLAGWSAKIAFFYPPAIDISSTAIRTRARQGLSLRYLVPERVAAYILEKGLYRGETQGSGA
ncbi:MAG: nicotinate-nucleotide adenylyltransferase [Bacillota bacterium]